MVTIGRSVSFVVTLCDIVEIGLIVFPVLVSIFFVIVLIVCSSVALAVVIGID